MPTQAQHRQLGITLVESCVVLAIACMGVGAALPAYERAVERHHVEGAAAQLRSDFHFARSQAASSQQSVRFSVGAATSNCYVVHTGGAKDCDCGPQGEAICKAGARALRTGRFAADGPISLHSNSPSMLIHPGHGTVTPTGTIRVQGRQGARLHLVVNILGRMRSCVAAGALPGQPNC
ncbi:MAG: GspH/FimT family pseudopilin [Burkholderiales bacterium]|nr:GspH/FimT family pseudopilin [Burkholderiales bacterium]MDE2454162.1 GspH/FimT family pseudopilin [Burkholderiales bacterium]